MTSESRARFADAVRDGSVDVVQACLLIGCEVQPDLELDPSLVEIDRLVASVQLRSRTPVAVAVALQLALGEEGGFHGSQADYDDLRSSLLHEVLRRRRGLPSHQALRVQVGRRMVATLAVGR